MSNASQAWLRQDAMVGGDHKWLAGGDWTTAKFAQRAKNVKLALNSKITHLNSRSQSALASNILVQHIEQPMHRYLFLRLMD